MGTAHCPMPHNSLNFLHLELLYGCLLGDYTCTKYQIKHYVFFIMIDCSYNLFVQLLPIVMNVRSHGPLYIVFMHLFL